MTKTEMLAEVENAINAVMVGGQSYKIGSRSLTRADLGELKNWRNQLIQEVNAEQASNLIGGTSVGVFSGR